MSEIRTVVLSPGYTPGRRDLAAVVDLIADDDEAIAEAAARALLRSGSPGADAARGRFEASTAPARGRICALIGRIAKQQQNAGTPVAISESRASTDEGVVTLAGRAAASLPGDQLVAWLVARLDDRDPVTRRRAATALGKLVASVDVEGPLLTAWDRATTPVERKPIAAALGNIGTARSLAALEAHVATPATHPGDPELARVVGEALQKLGRSATRAQSTSIDASRAPPFAVAVLLHVRAGLEPLLLDELAALGISTPAPRVVGRGRVLVELDRPLADLFAARTFLHFALVLPAAAVNAPTTAPPAAADGALLRAAVEIIAADRTSALLAAFTCGPVRYRIDWVGAGHRRALTYRIAAAVARRRPELVNDPREAPWEITLAERPGRAIGAHARQGSDAGSQRARGTVRTAPHLLHAELWPRAIVDPRFAYRQHTVPASSHPTIAAALAHAAGIEPNDVVWDPFVGAGAELVERALRGPYARLYGSDREATALDAAKHNLAAAKVDRVTLLEGDAKTFRPPEPVSLVITNPPMGRRVSHPANLASLLTAALRNIATALRPGGRLVWMCPAPGVCLEVARELGFTLADRRTVDMGGFDAELQVLRLDGSPPRATGRDLRSPRGGGDGRSRLAPPRRRA